VKKRHPDCPRTHSSIILRAAPHALAAAILAVPVAACDELRPLAPLATDLSRPVHRTTDQLPLTAIDTTSQASLDALEARYRMRPGLTALVELLETAVGPDGPAHPVLLQRIALIRAELAGFQTKGLETVIAAGTRLRQAAPGTAEAVFIEGWIPWRFIRPDDRRPLVLTAELRPFADAVRESWTRLIAQHPDFVGPRGYNAARVRAHLAELAAVVAVRTEPQAVNAEATQTQPVALDTNQLRALEALQRFDGSTDGERRSICSAWPSELLAEPGGAPLARLAFSCAVHDAQGAESVGALTNLMRIEGLTSVSGPLCRQWRILGERFGFDHLKAMSGLPPIDCP